MGDRAAQASTPAEHAHQQAQQHEGGGAGGDENQHGQDPEPVLSPGLLSRLKHPTQDLPPALRTVRRSVELLSVSYFLNIFAPILSIQNFAISKLEADLDGSQPDSYLPILIPKLLVSLTGDRTTNYSNWESRLRREFLRREPHENPLGAEPAKVKPKIAKRVIGYVYIAEAIPPSSLPTVGSSHLAQLAKSQDGVCHHAAVDSHDPTDPSHPLHAPESDRTESAPPHTHPSDTTELSNKHCSPLQPPSSNQVDPRTSEGPSAGPKQSEKLPTEEPIRSSDLLESKPLTAASSEHSSPAPQHPGGSTTITWSSLSPTIKLKALFKLCEWHFSTSHDLERFRRLVDAKAHNPNISGLDEQFDWRQERCGLDSQGHHYWLSGQGIESRLWVQRREPQPPIKPITLRIPPRAKKKSQKTQANEQKRKHATQESSAASSTPAAKQTRRCSSGAPPDPKRAKLTGTRKSQRLRTSTQVEPCNRSTSPRPPTMITIKKTCASQDSESGDMKNPGPNGSRRPASRRRANHEVWQDVPPGWLDEVVAPASKPTSTVFSSDLSEVSDEEEFVDTPRQPSQGNTKAASKSIPTHKTPEAASTDDESLSELSSSDSSEASSDMSDMTCQSGSDGPDGSALTDGTEDADEAAGLPTAEGSRPERKTIAGTEEPSPQLATLDSSLQLIPKVVSGTSPPRDAARVEYYPDGSDAFCPELKGHPLDPDWIEWEVVCANLNDWKHFSLQFKDTESQSEKQLVEFINNDVLPQVIAAHIEEGARQQKEEALAQRKRSSRLATRDAVQAQATLLEGDNIVGRDTRMHSDRLAAKRLKEIELEESRKVKEEDQRLTRLREREERIALREAQLASERDAEVKRAERARLRAESKLQGKAIKVARAGVENSVRSIDSARQWELSCEICGVIGVNMDDGSEVICCDQCEIWQHLVCHDRADEIMKRPKRNWATSDFLCSDCSGDPIPRAVKKLRTHINGKPKPPPRQRTSKAKDELTNPGPIAPGPSTTKSKITILMSNPNRLGGTTLNEVSPNMRHPNNLAHNASQRQNANPSGENSSSRPKGNLAAQAPPIIAGPTPMVFSSSARSVNTTTAATAPDLTKYYDDLEKLCRILRTNTSLHRTLPIEVMHRVRRYLLDQQQRQRGQQVAPTPTPLSAHPSDSSIAANLHPSLNSHSGQATTPSPICPNLQSLSSNYLGSTVVAHDPRTIDPQLQQLTSKPEPLDTNTHFHATSDATTPTTAVANLTTDHPASVMSESYWHTAPSISPALPPPS